MLTLPQLWSEVLGWTVLGTIAAVLIGIGFSVLSMNPPQHTMAQVSFTVAAIILIFRTAWWLSFEQSATAKTGNLLLLGFAIFGAIGILWVTSLRWVHALRPVAMSDVPQSGAPEKPSNPPTLSDLFKNDFPNVMKYTGDRFGIQWNNGTITPILVQNYLDFPAKTEFVGFYVSTSPQTYETCLKLADSVQAAIQDLRKRVKMSAGDVGGVNNLDDLTFSGRVFIYHEDSLSNPQW